MLSLQRIPNWKTTVALLQYLNGDQSGVWDEFPGGYSGPNPLRYVEQQDAMCHRTLPQHDYRTESPLQGGTTAFGTVALDHASRARRVCGDGTLHFHMALPMGKLPTTPPMAKGANPPRKIYTHECYTGITQAWVRVCSLGNSSLDLTALSS